MIADSTIFVHGIAKFSLYYTIVIFIYFQIGRFHHVKLKRALKHSTFYFIMFLFSSFSFSYFLPIFISFYSQRFNKKQCVYDTNRDWTNNAGTSIIVFVLYHFAQNPFGKSKNKHFFLFCLLQKSVQFSTWFVDDN